MKNSITIDQFKEKVRKHTPCGVVEKPYFLESDVDYLIELVLKGRNRQFDAITDAKALATKTAFDEAKSKVSFAAASAALKAIIEISTVVEYLAPPELQVTG